MIDAFTGLLQQDGFQVFPRVMMEGYSAGGTFAREFTVLHPDRVQAIAPGGTGFFTLPEETRDDIAISWPVGIDNLQSLVGHPFDPVAYKDIKQFLFAGDRDPGYTGHGGALDSLDEGDLSLFWQSFDQLSFVQRFGSTPLLREANEISYLNSRGSSNISLHTYPGGHGATPAAIAMFMNFFLNEGYPKSIPSQYIPPTPTPTPSMPIVIDGFSEDWATFPHVEVQPIANANFPYPLITGYDIAQDSNFLDILVKTRTPIRDKTAQFLFWLTVKEDDGTEQSGHLVLSADGSSEICVGSGCVASTLQVPVGWKDVVEIQIPKSAFRGSTFEHINGIRLYISVNGKPATLDDESFPQ